MALKVHPVWKFGNKSGQVALHEVIHLETVRRETGQAPVLAHSLSEGCCIFVFFARSAESSIETHAYAIKLSSGLQLLVSIAEPFAITMRAQLKAL